MATSKANHIHTLLLHYFITTKQVLVVLLLVVVVLPVASLSFQGDFDHYDEIRKRENAFPIFGDSDNAYVGRNLHRRIDTNNKNSSLLFCHVPIFQRYSSESGDASSCHIAYSASAASLLAMHHFNTGDGSVVDQLHQINHTCKMVMTTEIVDTTSSALSAVRDLTRMITRPSQDFERPQPCAILGSQISSVTSKLASLTGVFDLFQVSSSAMSTELENAKQYPLLARSHTDVAGFGEMSISYLKDNLGISHFGVLSPNDAYGQGFQQSVLEAAAGYGGMTGVSAQYLPTLTSKDEIDANIRLALKLLKQSGFNYIIAAFYPELFSTIMGIAYELGLAGEGKLWLISGTADLAPYILSGKFIVPKESTAAKAISGNGIIFCKGGLPGVGGSYDRFTDVWRKIGQNADALDYINKKQPSLQSDSTNCTQSGDFFEALPHHIVTFTYDAVVALGLAACGAQKSMNGEGGVFSGKMQRDFFSRNVFRGASGEFLLRDAFPTRTSDSSYFVMVNMAESMLNTTHISFKDSSLSFFWETGNRTWKMRGDQQFKYPGGGFIAPLEFEAQDEPSRKEQLFWVPLLVGVAISSLAFIGSGIYIHRRRKLVDSIWEVDLKQLEFDEPIEIIGSGTFGLVLLARYRGTDVAVKRVLPPKESEHTEGVASHEGFNPRSSFVDNRSYSSDEWSDDPETGKRNNKGKRPGAASGGHESNPGSNSRWIATTFLRTIKWTDDHTIMKREFIREMRLLSKLRHPNIITVMGAVLSNVHEPMLIMEYMKLGSLYDILHNRSMQLVGETVLPVLRDITQGMRFLHSATPAVIHSDLKAANVLIDSKFHAKVADFGLSQKKRFGGGGGTPYWMSPEVLRGETFNTTASDVYSFGIVLFEVYSRQDPYEGEDYATVIKEVKDKRINKSPTVPSECPSNIKSLMLDCLLEDAEKRPNFGEIDERLRRLDAELIEPTDLFHSFQEKKVQTARRRTDESLLFEIFPRNIAECLRNGEKVEPTVKDLVTIFFSDIVGFTDIASTLSPVKVSDMLDRLYNVFDELSHKHDIFKVETIGDAYMAVTNLVNDQDEDHAKRISMFAHDAIEAANKTLIDAEDPSRGCVDIRVGFHSGPCVANVVGSRSPRYCLFGDTVNTASRMESNSEKNRIHCSERSANLLREQDPTVELSPRGWITVKGKGEMKTFWVEKHAPTAT